jgi:hypothetical protein
MVPPTLREFILVIEEFRDRRVEPTAVDVAEAKDGGRALGADHEGGGVQSEYTSKRKGSARYTFELREKIGEIE